MVSAIENINKLLQSKFNSKTKNTLLVTSTYKVGQFTGNKTNKPLSYLCAKEFDAELMPPISRDCFAFEIVKHENSAVTEKSFCDIIDDTRSAGFTHYFVTGLTINHCVPKTAKAMKSHFEQSEETFVPQIVVIADLCGAKTGTYQKHSTTGVAKCERVYADLQTQGIMVAEMADIRFT
mmetsp:Transcript_16259/g.18088  ORF Transcript_16259/g.18088 Transcript_16259/m.18088 type:complete len:179 (+) Transcript_16259:125-661(+)